MVNMYSFYSENANIYHECHNSPYDWNKNPYTDMQQIIMAQGQTVATGVLEEKKMQKAATGNM